MFCQRSVYDFEGKMFGLERKESKESHHLTKVVTSVERRQVIFNGHMVDYRTWNTLLCMAAIDGATRRRRQRDGRCRCAAATTTTFVLNMHVKKRFIPNYMHAWKSFSLFYCSSSYIWKLQELMSIHNQDKLIWLRSNYTRHPTFHAELKDDVALTWKKKENENLLACTF